MTSPDEEHVRSAFLTALLRVDGWTSSLEIGFAHAGVIHTWTQSAPWAEPLELIRSAGRPDNRRWHHLNVEATDGRLDEFANRHRAKGGAP